MSRELVKQGYDLVATRYLEYRDLFKSHRYLDQLHDLLKPHSTILDLGCGAGIPIDRYLVNKGHEVIGIDISAKQIELARRNVPRASYAVRDMSYLREGEYQIDAVVSFYAIFHTPRTTHQELFKCINSFLSSGGLVLVTMGSAAWEGIEDDFHGAMMYWSHYGSEQNREIIERAGFKVLLDEIDTSGGERHQIFLARK